jgi:hypothetical protein
MYHTDSTPLCDDTGWLFHMKAGMPRVMGDEINVCGYRPDYGEEQDRKEFEEDYIPVQVRLLREDVRMQREWGMAVQEMEQQCEDKDGRKVIKLKRRDGMHMWFGVVGLDVKYEHEVKVPIDELKKG